MSLNALLLHWRINSKVIFYKPYIAFLFISSMLFGGLVTNAQSDNSGKIVKDTIEVESHSPHKATLLALAPGLGQIYNKKYWKLPIVYAGFGVTGYFAITNGQEYKKYRDAYTCAVTLEDACTNELAEKYSADDLQTIRDYYRRNMELSYIIMGAWYVLQMLDATVDAHLYYWNVNDDLSVRVDPLIQPIQMPGPASGMPGSVSPNGLRITVSF
jgi:hypothetical protein